MAKKIEVIVDVQAGSVDITSDKVLTLTEQVRILKKEIQKVGPGAEQDLLIGKFNDINDELDKTNLKSREFLGALSTLPGPVGVFAGSLDGAVNQLRNFSSFSFKDIKTQLGGLVDDFGKIATNLGKATGITKLYTTLNTALAASFVKVGVGEAAAATGARAFAAALVATGIGALVVLLGIAASALYEMATGEKEAAAQTAKLNSALETQNTLLDLNQKSTKRRNAETIADMKAQGKSEKEIRDKINEQNYNDYTSAFNAEKEAVKLFNDNVGKANAEDLKKLQDNLDKKVEARKDAYSKYLIDGKNGQATELAEQKAAEQKSIDANKTKLDKIREDNKTADQTLIDLKRENAVFAEKDERKRQDKELENQKIAEEEKIKELKISKEKLGLLLEQIDTKYKAKQSDINDKRKLEDKKKEDEEIKDTEDFNKKVAEIKIDAIEDELNRSIAERENKLMNDLSDLEKDKEFIKKSETEKSDIRKNLIKASENDVNKLKFDSRMKAAQDELMLLEAQQKTLIAGTDAYHKNSLAIENAAYKMKIDAAKGNATQIEAIKTEHEQNIKNIDLAAFEAKKQIEIQKYQVIAGIGASLQQLAGKNKALAIAGIVIEKAAAIGQIVANTSIANAKSVAASPLTFGQPWVTINTIAGILAGAATVSAAAKSIGEINSQGGGGGATAGSAAASPNLGRNYADGGMIGGKRHAEGGTMIEAEAGEAIMTRGAVTMFAPMLSMMNQMGGGTSFGNQLFIRPDAAAVSQPAQEQSPMIMKTYIVSNELTSESEKQARLKDLSTL
jgi:hypothetical protein